MTALATPAANHDTQFAGQLELTLSISEPNAVAYPGASALKLVGDRHRLAQRQRVAVARAACSDESLRRRRERQAAIGQIAGRPLLIDGYNLLIWAAILRVMAAVSRSGARQPGHGRPGPGWALQIGAAKPRPAPTRKRRAGKIAALLIGCAHGGQRGWRRAGRLARVGVSDRSRLRHQIQIAPT